MESNGAREWRCDSVTYFLVQGFLLLAREVFVPSLVLSRALQVEIEPISKVVMDFK